MTDEEIPLAPLQVADFDDERLRELATDVAALGSEIDVRIKAHAGYVDPGRRLTLDDAIAELVSGGALAVQLRYRFEGRLYWDTLLATRPGYRLVRTDVTTTMEKDATP